MISCIVVCRLNFQDCKTAIRELDEIIYISQHKRILRVTEHFLDFENPIACFLGEYPGYKILQQVLLILKL